MGNENATNQPETGDSELTVTELLEKLQKDKPPTEQKPKTATAKPATPKQQKTRKQDQEQPRVKVKKNISRHIMRRVNSELNLEKELPWHFEQGTSYHCISAGDIDSLSYLRAIVKQQHCHYVSISTWCMAKTDIEEISDWMARDYIERCDFYVGEIFKGTYGPEYELLKRVCKAYGCRLVVFRNHSKVMVIYGDKFNAVIESSANVNTNPRTEQTTITLDDGLVSFYKDFYDNIKSFEREFDEVPPYIVSAGSNNDGGA